MWLRKALNNQDHLGDEVTVPTVSMGRINSERGTAICFSAGSTGEQVVPTPNPSKSNSTTT